MKATTSHLFMAILFSFLIPALPVIGRDLDKCLPKGIQKTDIVSASIAIGGRKSIRVTVEQKLKEIKARCHKGKLVDPAGREIYFYRLEGCWGNPPADYQEILGKQRAELEKLRKRYHVIEMTCNPSGELIQ